MHSVARCDTLSAFIAETYVILEQDSVEVKFDPITRKTLFTALKHLMIYLFLIHDLTCIEDFLQIMFLDIYSSWISCLQYTFESICTV